MSEVIKRTKNPVKKDSAMLYSDTFFDPTAYTVENMHANKAFHYACIQNPGKDQDLILEELKEKYKDYRVKWSKQPIDCAQQEIDDTKLIELGIIPLCLDLEVASICDLACPFCYREFIATPDKVIADPLAKKLIAEAGELKIPSIKLNWRGEPLLYPRISKLIDFAKQNGVLETMINTNATQLTKKKSKELIEAGLDVMIYSFDGGTKETYEKMRPGRFRKNTFDEVYKNIINFAETRSKLGAKFPRTRIQMILNEDTFDEQENFFNLFSGYVDEISVNTYTERGGSLDDLSQEELKRFHNFCKENNLPESSPYMKDSLGKMWISDSRTPCEQLYQRLMVTYDGRAGMCCYDWGSQHPVGFLSDESFEDPNKVYRDVLKKVEKNHSGFELLKAVQLPSTHNEPEKKVTSIKDIWISEELNVVRRHHKKLELGKVNICKKCTFKDTYHWIEI